jgi:aldehyde:ferredoxin oxidoreductase
MISRECRPDNEGRFYWLLDKIVRREGIGDVLANGTYWAAKEIGNGAEAYAHNNIKNMSSCRSSCPCSIPSIF